MWLNNFPGMALGGFAHDDRLPLIWILVVPRILPPPIIFRNSLFRFESKKSVRRNCAESGMFSLNCLETESVRLSCLIESGDKIMTRSSC